MDTLILKSHVSCLGAPTRGTITAPDFCLQTLEPHIPIIPEGVYTVSLTWSPRFNCNLPLINGIKGHESVRIHSGNTASDTTGCVLVGLSGDTYTLYNSRSALRHLLNRVSFPFTLKVIRTSEGGLPPEK